MNLPIKSELETLEENYPQFIEFLDEKPSKQSVTKTYQESSYMPENEAIAVNNKKVKLTTHWRKRFLKAFQQEGCTPKTVAKYAIACDLNVEKVYEYFDKAAKEAENYVYEECDSLSFNNITEWLKYFKTIGIPKQCHYEAAIALNAIANKEYHPEPETIDGINLKAIYKFLSNALMGLPQEQLDEASARFLSDEFQNLINEANTDEADNEVRNMKRKIEDSLIRTIKGKSHKLDPLNTNTEEIEVCYSQIVQCKNIDK